MAKDANTLTAENIAAVQAAINQNAPNPAAVRLSELLARKLEKEQRLEDETEEQMLAARRSHAKTLEDQRKFELAKQAKCDHRLLGGMPNIAGQRDHQHHFHFICQACQKQWLDGELPTNLASQLDMDRIGGPNF